MKYKSPTLVVAAYNRIEPLKRVLKSISEAKYPNQEIALVISIDNDQKQSEELARYSEQFVWERGPKEVILHENNLGIRDHFNFCGDLSEKYGCVVFIEDDLFLAKDFYSFIIQALAKYENDTRIAGLSLFNYQRTEKIGNPEPFVALDDGGDSYFMQQASWGQIWTKEMWAPYKEWFNKLESSDYINTLPEVPTTIKRWPNTSWKKHYITYMILHDKYYVFPRIALCSNFDDPGTNRTRKTVYYQSPMLQNEKEFKFKSFDDSLSKYDSFFELLPGSVKKLNPDLEKFDFEVDLYASKDIASIKAPYILSRGKGSEVIMSFALKMKPHELNVIYNIEGDGVFLSSTKGFNIDPLNFAQESFIYFYRNLLSIKEMVKVLKYKLRIKLNKQ